ncbi:MAG: hypothetical protein RLO50_23190 [Azospirillaceae bacterium]
MRVGSLLLGLALCAVFPAPLMADDGSRAPRQLDLSPDTVDCILLQEDSFGPALHVELTPLGRTVVTAITTTRIGEAVPMVFEGVVLSRPVVHEAITSGSLLISGGESEAWPVEQLLERLGSCAGPDDP